MTAIRLARTRRQIVYTRNRMISQNFQMSLNTRHTDLNNNVLCIGGSGAGKTFRFVKPQLLQLTGSYIVTDPKGELFRDTAGFMQIMGYNVKFINILNETEMRKSFRFNPFKYVKADVDILKLINNLITNTNPEGASPSDPFWEKAEGMLLQALFFYVWQEGVPAGLSECKDENGEEDIDAIIEMINDPSVVRHHNLEGVMELLKFAEFKQDPRTGAKEASVLDYMMDELERKDPTHKAVINYNKVMRGAADTVRSIIISANSRLATVQSDAILNLLSEDEIDIEHIGTEKTIIYCIIPDVDTTFNFLVSMMYQLMFQTLYYEADFIHGGALPYHVTFLLDEFANVALPKDFLRLLSTMRSRNISSIIILQDLSQIKRLYKEGAHEEIQANCDVTVYLGGNGTSTKKELSELMGKATIDKRSFGETLGKQGSSSRNYDVLGRELMFPDELGTMDGKKCIVFVRGIGVILDDKVRSLEHPLWESMAAASKKELPDARIIRKQKELQGGIYCPAAELERALLEDKKEEKYYQEERRIAELTGGVPPEKPKKRVLTISAADLIRLKEKVDEPDEKVVFTEEFIKKSREAAARRVKEEEERKERERIEAEQEAKKHIKLTEMKSGEEILLYSQLRAAGFHEYQRRKLLELLKEKRGISREEILERFDPDFDDELFEAVYMAVKK